MTLSSLVLTVRAWFPSQYPIYCTKDTSMRRIPPLNEVDIARIDSLEQVQALIRHGARTPYAAHSCWTGYDITWNNCNVTELMVASPSNQSPGRPAPWLFRKLYDGSQNALGGNCLTGQLLLEGYQQEQSLGAYFYEAYLQSSTSVSGYTLFPTDLWTDIDTKNQIYLRSDDEQRTLMSGQIMMHSLFNVRTSLLYTMLLGFDSLIVMIVLRSARK